jgi:hypothetical protein
MKVIFIALEIKRQGKAQLPALTACKAGISGY